jgi:hypothetical protein
LNNAWWFFLVGTTLLGLFHFNPPKQSALLEVLTETEASEQHISAASLVFKERLERLSELVLILLVGGD